ncbi:MAG: helix-turn-helix transcriptional regulator [Bacteroidaceae bacterium]|nr:helix-turn-helix transcriptional regulator [Bacteroidaceae bacterium]
MMVSQSPALAIAIVDSNILSALGLQQILTDMMPALETKIFVTFSDLEASEDCFVHYFVASRIYFEHTAFFRAQPRRTIVLVNGELQIQGVPTINVCQDEKMIVKSIMALHRQAHPKGHPQSHHNGQLDTTPLPSEGGAGGRSLTAREIEVTVLLAKGLINKEIADRLFISTTTVITHRKNIMEKLHARSLVDIIVYAVMNGLVDLGEL